LNQRTYLLSAKSLAPVEEIEYDAVIIGSGMGGLATAAQMVSKGAKVLLLEKWVNS
jgi:prolycopene isomerase